MDISYILLEYVCTFAVLLCFWLFSLYLFTLLQETCSLFVRRVRSWLFRPSRSSSIFQFCSSGGKPRTFGCVKLQSWFWTLINQVQWDNLTCTSSYSMTYYLYDLIMTYSYDIFLWHTIFLTLWPTVTNCTFNVYYL